MSETIVLTERERRIDLHFLLEILPPGVPQILAYEEMRALLRRGLAAQQEAEALRRERERLSRELADVYAAMDKPISPFAAVLSELQELYDRKAADYGNAEDSLHNLRQSEHYGIPAWLGAVIRGGDKIARLQAFAKKGRLANESVEDSIRDLAVYAVIALQLYREKCEKEYEAEEARLADDGEPNDDDETSQDAA